MGQVSRARVIIGTDANGRPVSRWADTVAGDAPYGFMEPAFEPTVTRRQATPAELAASVARDTAQGYLHAKPAAASRRVGAWTPEKSAERMRISRERGTTRSVELAAATRATPTQREWNGTGLRPMLTPADRIVAEVAVLHGVTLAEITGPSRRPHLVDARAEAARRLSADPSLRLRQIGEALGGRDHSTVHALLRRAVG